MKFLIDFFPVLAFFLAYFIAYFIPEQRSNGIYWATAAAMIATVIQIAALKLMKKKIEKMHIFTFATIIVLGSLTLLLQDKRIIMWKPTVVNWVFGVVFIGSQYIGEKNIIRRMMEKSIELPDNIWKQLNFMWASFFIFLGIANLYVAFNFSEETWVNFKMFGILGLTFVFAIAQSFYLARFMPEEALDKVKADVDPENEQ
jgi:intracellular septation protein